MPRWNIVYTTRQPVLYASVEGTRCLSLPSRVVERAMCSLPSRGEAPPPAGWLACFEQAKPTRPIPFSLDVCSPHFCATWSVQGPDAIRCKRQTIQPILEIALGREDIPSDAPSLPASLPGPR